MINSLLDYSQLGQGRLLKVIIRGQKPAPDLTLIHILDMIEKSEITTLRFTPEGLEWVKDNADEAGVSKGRYIREVVLCQRPQAEEPFDKKDRKIEVGGSMKYSDLEKTLNHDLPKIGNNLNQLARYVNETRRFGPKQTDELSEIREEISKISMAILRALR